MTLFAADAGTACRAGPRRVAAPEI